MNFAKTNAKTSRPVTSSKIFNTPDVNVRVAKVSVVKEMPSYKVMPKFNHVPQACINPSPKKIRPATSPSARDWEIQANRLHPKPLSREKKELPDHLKRIPQDPNAVPKITIPKVDMSNMKAKERKALEEENKRKANEAVRIKKMKRNLTVLFSEIKNQIFAKKDENHELNDIIKVQVSQLKDELNSKRFMSYIFSAFLQNDRDDIIADKYEFKKFCHIFVPTMLDSEVNEIIKEHRRKKDLNATDNSIVSVEAKIDIGQLDPQFDKWLLDDEALNGVLNQKVTKNKNSEFRMKVEAWKKRENDRKKIKQRMSEHAKIINDYFNKTKLNFEPNELIFECHNVYLEHADKLKKIYKDEKTLNDLLCEAPDVSVLQILHIEKVIDARSIAFAAKHKILENFIFKVRTKCITNGNNFNFHNMPEFIIKEKITRKDYEVISKLLKKVKSLYLEEKLERFPEKKLEEINVTDEDWVPLDYLETSLNQIKLKFDSKKILWVELLKHSQSEIQKKIKAIGMESENNKRLITESVLINEINNKMEQTHMLAFKMYYLQALLLINFKSSLNECNSQEEFKTIFEESMMPSEKYQNEMQNKQTEEMNKFLGKTAIGDGNESQRSNLTYFTSNSKQTGKVGFNMQSPGGKAQFTPREQNKGGDFQKGLDNLDSVVIQDDQDEVETERVKNAKEQHEELMRTFFVDPKTNQQFDPSKKFGVIESEGTLLYDNVSTSYPLNLPADYYCKYIQNSLPKEQDGKWFIRPHHIENLTQHVNSIKDSYLNTHYFSDYNMDYGKKIEVGHCEEAISDIEQMLDELKHKQRILAEQKNIQLTDEFLEQCERETKKIAQEKFEKMMSDRQCRDKTLSYQLCIDAYNEINTDKRIKERKILNEFRDKEYQKNRPPAPLWYSLKNNTFNQECYRNRVALKPNNENSVYLKRLQDPYLY